MGFTLIGMVTLAFAPNYPSVLAAAALIGAGSAIFHPESSRIARLASGGRHGLAQSIFQVGGNAGSAMGPLLAAWIVNPHGQASLAWLPDIEHRSRATGALRDGRALTAP
jgi:FSR family fosmidomycin resistance protein-like MFS transporter